MYASKRGLFDSVSIMGGPRTTAVRRSIEEMSSPSVAVKKETPVKYVVSNGPWEDVKIRDSEGKKVCVVIGTLLEAEHVVVFARSKPKGTGLYFYVNDPEYKQSCSYKPELVSFDSEYDCGGDTKWTKEKIQADLSTSMFLESHHAARKRMAEDDESDNESIDNVAPIVRHFEKKQKKDRITSPKQKVYVKGISSNSSSLYARATTLLEEVREVVDQKAMMEEQIEQQKAEIQRLKHRMVDYEEQVKDTTDMLKGQNDDLNRLRAEMASRASGPPASASHNSASSIQLKSIKVGGSTFEPMPKPNEGLWKGKRRHYQDDNGTSRDEFDVLYPGINFPGATEDKHIKSDSRVLRKFLMPGIKGLELDAGAVAGEGGKVFKKSIIRMEIPKNPLGW